MMNFPSPEQEEEAVNLQDNSNNGPAYQDHTHTPEEETGGLHLVLLKEEAKRPFQPDDKGQPSNEEYLQEQEETKKDELLQDPCPGRRSFKPQTPGEPASHRATEMFFRAVLSQFWTPGFAAIDLLSLYSCLRLDEDHLWTEGQPAPLRRLRGDPPHPPPLQGKVTSEQRV